jgi:hypothetical protein
MFECFGNIVQIWENSLVNYVYVMVIVALLTSTARSADETALVKKEATGKSVKLQEMTSLSSMQFYTYFALVRNMLEGTWDDNLFQQFALYDGMNLQMMQRHEEKLERDKKWEPFLKMKNALHKKVYEELKPLIRNKRENQNLSATDTEKLKALDRLILETLIK